MKKVYDIAINAHNLLGEKTDINCDIKKLKRFKTLKKLYIQSSDIIKLKKIRQLENLEYLNLERSKIDNLEILNELKTEL